MIQRYFTLSICFSLIFAVSSISAQELQGWKEKTFEIKESYEYKFGSYALEYFSFQDGKIRCLNALSTSAILYQFCDDLTTGKKETQENMGKVFYFNDSLAFAIVSAFEGFIEVKVLSAQEFAPEVFSSRWFSAFLELSSTSSQSKVLAYPKDTIKASLKLKNGNPDEDGKELKENYKLYALLPKGWEASFKTGENKVISVNLAPEEEASISVEITAPEDFFKDYVISIIAEGGDRLARKRVRYNLPVIRGSDDFYSKLRGSTPEIFSRGGEKIEVSLELENKDYASKHYRLSALAPENWNVSFYYSGLKINRVQVAGKSSVSIKAAVEIPSGAEARNYNLTFKALAEKSNADYMAAVILEPPQLASKLRTSTPEIITKPGEEIKLGLELENKGKSEEYYLLSAAAPQDWEVTFYHKNFKVPSVQLASESSVSLEGVVKIPKEAALGDYQLGFVAKGDKSRAERNVTLHVEGSYALAVELSKLYARIIAGEQEEIVARVVNNGKTALTGIELSLEAPEGWSYKIVPEGLARLNAGKAGDFSIALVPPPDAGVGDYFLKLKARAEQARAEDVSLRVTVQQKSSYGLLGIAVAVLSVGMLLGIYRKFGRR